MTTIFKQRFDNFFKRNHERINFTDCTICIGNEGMDLDSFISSLVVSYAEDVIHVVNMRKEVFKSKGELMKVCEMFNIDINDLIYLERPLGGVMTINTKKIGTHFRVKDTLIPLADKNLKLVLTDHNQVVDELQGIEVTMVIDHHLLENVVKQAKRIYIDIDVGSATTLVAKYLGEDLSRKHHCVADPNNTDPEKITLCQSIARLLIIPIIMDTSHLKRRTSIFDKLEYDRLKKQANIQKKELKIVRKSLKEARLNDDKLPTEIILQKDFKLYTHNNIKFGIASVKYDYEKWVDRETKNVAGIPKDKIGVVLYMQLDDFRKKCDLDFLLVNCKFGESRTLMLINFPLIEIFAKENNFEKRTYKGIDFYHASPEQSRKIIAPKIHLFLENISFGRHN